MEGGGGVTRRGVVPQPFCVVCTFHVVSVQPVLCMLCCAVFLLAPASSCTHAEVVWCWPVRIQHWIMSPRPCCPAISSWDIGYLFSPSAPLTSLTWACAFISPAFFLFAHALLAECLHPAASFSLFLLCARCGGFASMHVCCMGHHVSSLFGRPLM